MLIHAESGTNDDHFDLNLFSLRPPGTPSDTAARPGAGSNRRRHRGRGAVANRGCSVGLDRGKSVGRRNISAEVSAGPGQARPGGRTIGTHRAKSTGCGGGDRLGKRAWENYSG